MARRSEGWGVFCTIESTGNVVLAIPSRFRARLRDICSILARAPALSLSLSLYRPAHKTRTQKGRGSAASVRQRAASIANKSAAQETREYVFHEDACFIRPVSRVRCLAPSIYRSLKELATV